MKTYSAAEDELTSQHTGIVFVGGPIQYAIGDGLFDEALRSLLITTIATLTESGLTVMSAHAEEQFGQVDMSGKARHVTRRDYDWMQQADVYLCILPIGPDGKPYRSDGTCVELGWASALRKRIVIVRSFDVAYSHLIEGLGVVSEVGMLDVAMVARDPTLLLAAVTSSQFETACP